MDGREATNKKKKQFFQTNYAKAMQFFATATGAGRRIGPHVSKDHNEAHSIVNDGNVSTLSQNSPSTIYINLQFVKLVSMWQFERS